MPDRLFSTKEAAAMLGTYERAVLNLTDLHKIPYSVASRGRRSEMRLYTPEAITRLGPLVYEWKNRPRIGAKKAATA